LEPKKNPRRDHGEWGRCITLAVLSIASLTEDCSTAHRRQMSLGLTPVVQ